MNSLPETFVDTVREMRRQQRLYYSTADRVALRESKRLEKRVDAMLAEAESGQGRLMEEVMP